MDLNTDNNDDDSCSSIRSDIREEPEAASFVQRLRTDRFIKIVIGLKPEDELKSYLVPQVLLENASDYFKAALKPGTFSEGEEGTLRFADDRCEVWQIFLYWLFHKRLPTTYSSGKWNMEEEPHEEDALVLVRCWCFGNKYGASNFQDIVMYYLLKFYEVHTATIDPIKEAIANSPTFCPLRRLMAEQAVCIYNYNELSNKEFDELSYDGFMGEFIEAYSGKRFRSRDARPVLIDDEEAQDESPKWHKYMVGKGVKGLVPREQVVGVEDWGKWDL